MLSKPLSLAATCLVGLFSNYSWGLRTGCMQSGCTHPFSFPDSSRPHGLQHARLPCPSLTPGVCSDSCSSSQWCHLTIFFPSIRVFSNESVLLISFRMDWLDLLAVQGTLKSLLQHHSLKASVLQCSAFFMVQLSHPYMTTGKTTALSMTLSAKWCLCFLICCLGWS